MKQENPFTKRRRSRCSKCLRCCCCSISIFLLILFATLYITWSASNPQLPSYNVERLRLLALRVNRNLHVDAKIAVTVRAHNPNDHIAFYFGRGSSVIVRYAGRNLCSGKLPPFHQPERDTKKFVVLLRGTTEFGRDLQERLIQDKEAGTVHVEVIVKVPVSVVVVEQFALRTVEVHVNCSLVVDEFTPGHKIGILSSVYKYGFRL